MDRLSELGRLDAQDNQTSLMWKRYEDEVPGRRVNNIWAASMSPKDKRYVVQTDTKAIQRCMLMTTDPGDLVLDPTSGSATTLYMAEQWGRRWIACDTSRVAVAIARQRLMTATYDFQRQLPHEAHAGVGDVVLGGAHQPHGAFAYRIGVLKGREAARFQVGVGDGDDGSSHECRSRAPRRCPGAPESARRGRLRPAAHRSSSPRRRCR